MFLWNFHIFINKRAMLQQKFIVQVTTLPYCDDITRFDGTGFWWPKIGKFYSWKFLFLVKNCKMQYFSRGLRQGRPSFRKSLRPSKREHPALQNKYLFFFFIFFCLHGSGSSRPKSPKSMRIRISNTVKNKCDSWQSLTYVPPKGGMKI